MIDYIPNFNRVDFEAVKTDYIKRQGLLDLYATDDLPEREGGYAVPVDVVRQNILDQPAADVRPVVRGEWIWNEDNGYYNCSKCAAISPREDQWGEYIDCPNFCPNCGADMRGEDK